MITSDDMQQLASCQEDLRLTLKEIEKRYKVENWCIDNIKIWPVIKLLGARHFSECNINNPLDNTTNTFFKNKFSILFKITKMLNFIYLCLKDHRHEDKIDKPRDILFLTYSGYRKAMIEGKYYLANIMSFMNRLPDKNCLILELTNNNTWRIPRYGKSIFVHIYIYICTR